MVGPASSTGGASPLSPTSRPCLRPEAVLPSRGAECQIGLDAVNSLRIPDADGRLRSALSSLDGHRSWSVVLAEAKERQVDTIELSRLLHALVAAGLADLNPSGSLDPWRSAGVRLVGAGTLGAAVGELLVRSGVGRLHVVDGQPAARAGTRAEALVRRCAALRRRARYLRTHDTGDETSDVRVSSHWTKPESRDIALTILAPDALEADRGIAAGLLRRDAPHLVVRPTAAGAVVGPLVVPGRSSCLHCSDLTRRDADPAWPALVGQLTRRQVTVPPAIAAWATGTAVTQVLRFLGGDRPETLGATLEVCAPTYALSLRAWPLHPECGCHWNRPVGRIGIDPPPLHRVQRAC